MKTTRLEMVYQVNVVLYIEKETTLRNYRLINKRALEAIRCLKVNPRSIYLGYNFLFNFFPHLNTLTGNMNTIIHSLTQKQMNQITWFDCSNAEISPEAFDDAILSKIITIAIQIDSFSYVQKHCPNVRKVVVTVYDDVTFENIKFKCLQKLVIKKSVNEKLLIKISDFVATNPDVAIGLFNIERDEVDIDTNSNDKYHRICIKEPVEDKQKITFTSNIQKFEEEQFPYFKMPTTNVKSFDEKYLNSHDIKKHSYLCPHNVYTLYTLNITFDRNSVKNIDLTNLFGLLQFSVFFKKTVETTITMPNPRNEICKLYKLEVVTPSPNKISFVGTDRCTQLQTVNINCAFYNIALDLKNRVQLLLINTGNEIAKVDFRNVFECYYCVFRGLFDVEEITLRNDIFDCLLLPIQMKSLRKVVFLLSSNKKECVKRNEKQKLINCVGHPIEIVMK
ncbi:hypothetical protein EIN_199820 [Entamoeba invadens IP1]|uniref:Uncharacterized protein n=1 Tax=Entamoeba invadens IP1 TaxID=370355 RepID=A0A0A1U647_ENTIV|nr:hypothetical protein EIN_199820 [Entamoeba invadens IP1]ELP89843.1 hypothetical protein EIN_199820 [Entamoeba invadens IP1]|eukprot:XP_004256614.1 hypothetical protein EIN_199820 [Entamoeba invadens IP1]